MTYLKVGLPLMVVILWQFFSMQGFLPYNKLPSPLEIAVGMKTLFIEGLPPGYLLYRHALESLFRVFCGFCIAACLGIPLGYPYWLVPKAQYPPETLYRDFASHPASCMDTYSHHMVRHRDRVGCFHHLSGSLLPYPPEHGFGRQYGRCSLGGSDQGARSQRKTYTAESARPGSASFYLDRPTDRLGNCLDDTSGGGIHGGQKWIRLRIRYYGGPRYSEA